MRIVDLRSDTITRPTDAMRKAMADAEVGDDVFGEDPTVNRLEALAAEMLGKQAGLLVTSGTMGNLVSLLTHCTRGDEIILGDQAHVFHYEQGGCAALGGIMPHTVPNLPDGRIDPADLQAAVRHDDVHAPISRLILLENTHNRCSGSPLGIDYMQAVRNLADEHNLKVHLDGARLFNAATALGLNASDLVADVDSVSICLSKGLAAPVGSVVCGSTAFIDRARRSRKVVGGGMRQAGVIAAAGIIALTEMSKRLDEDHANARKLARGLAEIKDLIIDPEMVSTNIVFFQTDPQKMDAKQLETRLDEVGIRVLALGPTKLRAVTHYHITADDIDHALVQFRAVVTR